LSRLFANTLALAGLIWRRDRIQIPIWVVSIAFWSAVLAAMLPSLYPPGPEREIIAQTFANPALISMLGPGYGLDNYHMGAIMAHQMLLFTAVIVAVMNIILILRHTRRDEEQGRIEVVRSLPVGRLANAASAVLVLVLTNLILGAAVAVPLALLGLEGMDWQGSLLYGAVLAATGIFFAAATLFFAQLTETSRTASAYAFAFLGLSFLLRAIGDISSEPLSVISPLGLVLRAQVYVNNYWWPVVLVLVAAGAPILVAFRLNTTRDLEAGIIPAKPGRRYASRLLQSPLGLVLRLEKTVVTCWAVGMFVMGASYGSIFGDVETFAQTSDLYKQILPSVEGFSLTDQFLAMLLAILSMIAAVPALQIILRLRGEERANRVEHLLAGAVSRNHLMAAFLVVAVAAAAVMQALSVVGLWLAAAAVVSDPFPLRETLAAALVYVPLIWILIGLAAALIGYFPQHTNLVWIYLGASLFTTYFGSLLRLPEWTKKLTPWGHIPSIPLEEVSAGTVFLSAITAAILMVIGFTGYSKRDIIR